MKGKGLLVIGGLALGGVVVYALTRPAKAPPGKWCCLYDPAHGCFATYEELVAHVKSVHPGERIPLILDWT